MKFSELIQKSRIEILAALKEKRERLRQLFFDLNAGKVKNIREIRQIKKDIARLLTIVNKTKEADK